MPTLHNVEQRSQEWHELRKNKVTASNAGKLLEYGVRKAIEPSTFEGNIWTERGQLLESEALELYERIRDVDVLRIGFVTNDKYPNCGASPDGITDRLIEVKCFNKDKHSSIEKSNIPFEVMAQVQFGMMICELDLADLVLYNPDLPAKEALKIIEIKRDEKIITNIQIKLELAF